MKIIEIYIVRINGLGDYKRGGAIFQKIPIYRKIFKTENNRYFLETGKDLDEITEEEFLKFQKNSNA